MKEIKLDVDGFHSLVIILQRSGKLKGQIHISNLGCVKYDFPQFYRKEADDWWRIQTNAFNGHLNHQAPMIPFSSDWHQKDPTFIMFRDILLIKCAVN